MLNRFRNTLLVVTLMLSGRLLYAQGAGEGVESVMRSNGKIYVVMAVCITILVGLFLYLVSIDRKISRIEDKQ